MRVEKEAVEFQERRIMHSYRSNYLKQLPIYVCMFFFWACCRNACSPGMENVTRGVDFSSAHLGNVKYTIYIPPEYDDDLSQRFPVLYLLHGGAGNHETYVCRVNLTRTINQLISDG